MVAVNHAQIRSDGEMAQLRLWFHGVTPDRILGAKTSDTTWEKLGDSVYVSLGSLTMTEAGGGKSYKAVRYLPQSASGLREPTTVNEPGRLTARKTKPRYAVTPESRVYVYNLKGARVGELEGSRVLKVSDTNLLLKRDLNLVAGSYMLPLLKKKVTLLRGVRQEAPTWEFYRK